jgi:DNA/RNA-binding domain of Phe-tRNA-synthetase-like protein
MLGGVRRGVKMHFSVQKELFNLLPGLTIGMVVALGMDNNRPPKEIGERLTEVAEDLKRNFGVEKAQDHLRIKPWRAAFARLGISGSRFPSSIEAMARRVLKGDPLPRINPIVDLYNSVSLKYLVPMGGHDLDTLKGDLHLGFAEGWEPFTPMGGGETVTVPKGELVYRDEVEVLTRNWVWRQCEKDKATEKTKNIFIPIDVLGEVGRECADQMIRELCDLIPNYLGGTIFSEILDIQNPSVQIPYPP